MDVNSAPGVAGTPRSTASETDKPAAASAALASDFETFLKMLTVQMQNQDPMNPMESGEFAVQLATFASVEQQVRTNELLQSIGGQVGVMGMSQLAGWIGMEARTSGGIWVDGQTVTFAPDPAPAAETMSLVVRDAEGAEVARTQTPASDAPLTWAPVGADGVPLPAGRYSFELESISGGDVLRSDPLDAYTRVIEARLEDGAPMLVLEGGVKAAPSDVTALRSPV